MPHLVAIGEIKNRTEQVNLSLKWLARRAEVDPSTVYKAANGDSESNGKTLRKLGDTLAAEEIRIARHLASLPHVQAALAERSAA
jgi:predicted transcriptional regulator